MGVSEYGDGAAWFRGSIIGKGGFGSVYLAALKNPTSKYSCFPPLMAVKSAEVSASGSIQKEKEVITNLKGCPYLIKCFGEETTIGSNGVMAYNLLLEYASGGTLSDRIEKSGGGGLAECEARVYTRSILRGLDHIHGNGYVHCDLKPENILLVPNSGAGIRAKIGDFGLAKRERSSKKRKTLEPYWRGTPMYLSPEAVVDKVQEAPSDIWALGCIVLYMLTGNLPWEGKKSEEIIRKIGTRGRLPKIPNELSKEAKDFLKGCFVRRSVFRHTSEMLLHHPFVEVLESGDAVEESVEFEFSGEVYSDDDSLSSWSEEELEEVENIEGVMGSDQSNETSKRAPLHSLRKRKQHCPVSLVIPVGIYQS